MKKNFFLIISTITSAMASVVLPLSISASCSKKTYNHVESLGKGHTGSSGVSTETHKNPNVPPYVAPPKPVEPPEQLQKPNQSTTEHPQPNTSPAHTENVPAYHGFNVSEEVIETAQKVGVIYRDPSLIESRPYAQVIFSSAPTMSIFEESLFKNIENKISYQTLINHNHIGFIELKCLSPNQVLLLTYNKVIFSNGIKDWILEQIKAQDLRAVHGASFWAKTFNVWNNH